MTPPDLEAQNQFWQVVMEQKQEIERSWKVAQAAGSNRQERRAAARAAAKKLRKGKA